MTIDSGWVTAAATVLGVALTIGGAWIHNSLSSRDEQISSTRAAQKVLFEKLDVVANALQVYKLHVAETYVNQAALQKMLDPIDRRLENIEKEMRTGHHPS